MTRVGSAILLRDQQHRGPHGGHGSRSHRGHGGPNLPSAAQPYVYGGGHSRGYGW